MSEKQNKVVSKTKNKNVSPFAWLIAGAGAYAFYLVARGMGWIKDKPAKEYEKLSNKPFIKNADFYKSRTGIIGVNSCYNSYFDTMGIYDILKEFNEELDPYVYTDEIKLLGIFKNNIKSQFDYSYISYRYTSYYNADFNSNLEYKIDAWTDDIALEELIRYLKTLPVTRVQSCKCNDPYQQEKLYMHIYSGMRKTRDDSLGNYLRVKSEEEAKMYCKYKGPRIYGYGW